MIIFHDRCLKVYRIEKALLVSRLSVLRSYYIYITYDGYAFRMEAEVRKKYAG